MARTVQRRGGQLHLRRAGRAPRAGGASMVIEKAQAPGRAGHDVVILLDSITRLARAHNTVVPAHAARSCPAAWTPTPCRGPSASSARPATSRRAGRLTIIATALIDTGSRMDEVIFEEFKGTGNMELVLDRKLADRRIFPAIDIFKQRHPQGRAAHRSQGAQQDLDPAQVPERAAPGRGHGVPHRQAGQDGAQQEVPGLDEHLGRPDPPGRAPRRGRGGCGAPCSLCVPRHSAGRTRNRKGAHARTAGNPGVRS